MLVSFRSRLIFLLLGLLAFAQLGTAVAVLSSVKEDHYKQGVQAINVAKNVFDLFLSERAEQLTQGVKILASDFGFKKAIATQETGTILSVLENHGARIGAEVTLLLSPSGDMLASTKQLNLDRSLSDMVMAARRSARTSISSLIAFDNKAYQLVLVPVKAPNTIAWVGMAFLMDQSLAEKIKKVTGLDVSFVGELKNGDNGSRYSTLSKQDQTLFFDSVQDMKTISKKPIFNDSKKYLSLSIPIFGGTQWGVLHLPYKPWLASYNNAQNQLLIIFAVALALALLVGVVLARSLTNPISRLMAFAVQIGRGDRQLNAPVLSGEFGLLSKTMTNMQNSIQEREDEVAYRALHSELTGFYNRVAGFQYLKRHLPRNHGSMMLLKIMHMNDINSMFGYDAGDCLVIESAKRIEVWAKEHNVDFLSHQDELFFMVFDHQVTPEDCISLQACFKEKMAVTEQSQIQLHVSISALLFEHTDKSVNSTVRRLDIALAIAEGLPELYCFYQKGEDEVHQRRLSIIQDLPDGLKNGQLFMVYQPKVGVAQHDCHEVEALIRWQHPTFGFIPPDEFIQVLERSGNIQPLTLWVIDTVLTQLKIWWEAGSPIRAAINLSALDLIDENLPSFVDNALKSRDLTAKALALEVTESAVMSDRERVISVLSTFQAQGIHLAIDDFGTGQSSLAYLRELPVNEVKIDRTFIQHIDINKHDEFIVQASIELSHSLGFVVTAEGAENSAGVEVLESLSCDKIQGYFYSRPLPAGELLEWVHAFNNTATNVISSS